MAFPFFPVDGLHFLLPPSASPSCLLFSGLLPSSDCCCVYRVCLLNCWIRIRMCRAPTKTALISYFSMWRVLHYVRTYSQKQSRLDTGRSRPCRMDMRRQNAVGQLAEVAAMTMMTTTVRENNESRERVRMRMRENHVYRD